MKRFLALLLSLSAVLTLCGCSTEASDALPEFRQLTYTSEYLTNGIVTGTQRLENTYNEQGQCIRWVWLEDGIQTETASYEYDENGNLSRFTAQTPEGESITTFAYTLDNRGNVLRMESFLDGVLNYTEENTYDKNGNLLTFTSSNILEEPYTSTTQYTYNLRGALIQEKILTNYTGGYTIRDYRKGLQVQSTQHNPDGSVALLTKYFYEDDGFFSKWISYNGDGSIHQTCQRVPDETGLVITELHYDEKGIQTNRHDVFTYDKYGNLLMQERYEDGEVYWRLTYTYEQVP